MEILHLRKRLWNSMTLNASTYHQSDYFCLTDWFIFHHIIVSRWAPAPCFTQTSSPTYPPTHTTQSPLSTRSACLSCLWFLMIFFMIFLYDACGGWTCAGCDETMLVGRTWKEGRECKKRTEKRERCADETGRLKNMMKAQHETGLWTNRIVVTGVLKQPHLTANAILKVIRQLLYEKRKKSILNVWKQKWSFSRRK